MNKKLLALAVGAAFALPVVASAQPTLYGEINVSLESEDDTGVLGVNEAWLLRDNASRIGVRGEAETNVDGLKGIYQAEFGVDATDGGLFSQRDIFVGLQGGFGTLKAGTFYTPFQLAQGSVDQFDDTSSDMSNHVRNEITANNIIQYTSPAIAEVLTLNVAVIPGETTGAEDGLADSTSISLVYSSGNLYGAVAVDSEMGGAFDQDATRFVLGYNTETFDLGLLFQQSEDTGGTYDETTMLLSGAYKTGDWKFKAQFATTEDDVGAGSEITMMGLGADYALGKSTTAYAFYTAEEVDGGPERTVIALGLEQRF